MFPRPPNGDGPTTRVLAPLLLPALLHACNAAEPGADPVVTDSAGVTIVTSPAPRWTVDDITESATLVASLGGRDGYPLGRVTDAVRLADGSVVFIDVQARAVKRFRPWAGVETLAGRGRGPGEVTAPGSLQRLPGDSVQLYDGALDRVTVFGPDGAFAYDVPVHPPAGRPPTRVLRFRDTLLVGLAPLPERRVLARSDAGDLGVTPYAVVLYDMDAAVLDTIATIPGYRDIRTGTTSMMPTYGLGGAFAVHDDVLLHGAGAAPSYRVMDAAGRTLRIHRLLAPRRPVDRDSLAALLAGDEEGLARLGTALADHPVLQPELLPDSQPAYDDIRVYDGRVWLASAEPFRIPSRTYQVLGPDGRWLGAVRLPDDASLLDVADGHVVLRRTGALDVQAIEVYELGDLQSKQR